jgi:hypothetical protein
MPTEQEYNEFMEELRKMGFTVYRDGDKIICEAGGSQMEVKT